MSIVVALESSTGSRNALAWAVERAKRTRSRLTLLAAQWEPHGGGSAARLEASLRQEQDVQNRELDVERRAVLAKHPDLTVDTLVVRGDVVPALIDATSEADVFVIGGRGMGPIKSTLLGGVSDAVVTHGSGLIAVVPDDADVHRSGPVVVGVDGSEPSRVAAQVAFAEASATGVGLDVVSTWELTALWSSYRYPVETLDDTHVAEATQESAHRIVEPLRQQYPDVAVSYVTVPGHPTTELVEASRRASLVVAGARGWGRVAGIIVGSTSRDLAQKSHAPVLIVKDDDVASAEPGETA